MFGLSISNLIVKSYDGKLSMKTKINKGSTFEFVMDMKLVKPKSSKEIAINQIES
jgi:K+-sensing histidine kinase KdpD